MKEEKISPWKAGLLLSLGTQIISKLDKQFPEAKIGEAYTGYFKPYIQEYFDTFLKKDLEQARGTEFQTDAEKELTVEYTYIECFCKWLEKEKNLHINEG